MIGEQISASWETASRRLSGWAQAIPVARLRLVITVLMALWVLAGVAQLVGILLPDASPEAQMGASGVPSDTPRAVTDLDIEALQGLNLFGESSGELAPGTEAALVEEPIEAEKTRLNLVLEGIVYSPRAEESAAVIVHQGRQETFAVGEKIPVGNQVTLAQVLLDRVVLNNNGNYESLWLYDQADSAASGGAASRGQPNRSQPNTASQVNDMRGNQAVTAMAANYRDRVLNNPTSLAEVIRITPAKEDGAMVGYRISPGKDREQFEKLGLQANDVVTSINDIDLNEPSNALEVYKLMRTATEASFTIDRGGETLQVQVALDGQ